MDADSRPNTLNGFVVAADEGKAFWFLNTLTINKVGAEDSEGRLSIVDHRVPPGFAPPPHIHEVSDEAFVVLDGEFEGFCGDRGWKAGPGSLVYLPRGIPHGFNVSEAGPGRIIVVVTPGGFDQFVAELGEPAHDLRLPDPVLPIPPVSRSWLLLMGPRFSHLRACPPDRYRGFLAEVRLARFGLALWPGPRRQAAPRWQTQVRMGKHGRGSGDLAEHEQVTSEALEGDEDAAI